MPPFAGIAALQRDRLRQLEQQLHEQEDEEAKPDHAPELPVDGLGRNPLGAQKPDGTSAAQGWPAQHRNRRSLFLQQLCQARTALLTKARREERSGATHATDRPKTSYSCQLPPQGADTLYPWERLAAAAHDAQEAEEGLQADYKGKEAGQRVQELVADFLDGRHMLWSCERPPCGWYGVSEALKPAEVLLAARQYQQQLHAHRAASSSVLHQRAPQHTSQRLEPFHRVAREEAARREQRLRCARSLCALVSDAAADMLGVADTGAMAEAAFEGLAAGEAWVKGASERQQGWPCEAAAAGHSPGGAGASTSSSGAGAGPLACAYVDMLWEFVLGAQDDGRKLAAMLQQHSTALEMLIGCPRPEGAGVAEQEEAWRTLGRLAREGRKEHGEVLAHALMGLLLLHRAYRDPWSLLAHTNGADPFRLAAFRIVHSAVYNALQQSAEYSRSSFPPLHVLYGVTALVPPECLAALAAARGPFESLDGPLDSAPGIPELSKQHLTMVVEVLLERPMDALLALMHCTQWNAARLAWLAPGNPSQQPAAAGPCPTGPPESPHRPWAGPHGSPAARAWREVLVFCRGTETVRSLLMNEEVGSLVSGPAASLRFEDAFLGGPLGSPWASTALVAGARSLLMLMDRYDILDEPYAVVRPAVSEQAVQLLGRALDKHVEYWRGYLGSAQAWNAEAGAVGRGTEPLQRMCSARVDALGRAVEYRRCVGEAAVARSSIMTDITAMLYRGDWLVCEVREAVEALRPGLLAAHPGTWGAAVRQLEAHEEECILPEEQDPACAELRSILCYATLGLVAADGVAGHLPLEAVRLPAFALAGYLTDKITTLARARPQPWFAIVAPLLIDCVSGLPYGLCDQLVRHVGDPWAPATDAPSGHSPAYDTYDRYIRLVLYDMAVALRVPCLCKALATDEAGGSSRADEEGGAASPTVSRLERGNAKDVISAISVLGGAAVAATTPAVARYCGALRQRRQRLAMRGQELGQEHDSQGGQLTGAAGSPATERSVGAPNVSSSSSSSSSSRVAGGRPPGLRLMDELVDLNLRCVVEVDPQWEGSARGASRGGGSSSSRRGRYLQVVLDAREGGTPEQQPPSAPVAGADGSGAATVGVEDDILTGLFLLRRLELSTGLTRVLTHGPEAAVVLLVSLAHGHKQLVNLALQPELPDSRSSSTPEAELEAAAAGGAVRMQVLFGSSYAEGMPTYHLYDKDAMERTSVRDTATSGWRRLLALLRDAFFPADKRVGGTWVYGDGVEGTLRALLLVAKVREQLHAEDRDLVASVVGLHYGKAQEAEARAQRRRQPRQQQGPGGSGPGAQDGAVSVEEFKRAAADLQEGLGVLLGDIGLLRVVRGPVRGAVFAGAGEEGTRAWGLARQAVGRMLRALRTPGGALREALSVELQVVEVEKGNPRSLVPPPRGSGRAEGGGADGAGKGKVVGLRELLGGVKPQGGRGVRR